MEFYGLPNKSADESSSFYFKMENLSSFHFLKVTLSLIMCNFLTRYDFYYCKRHTLHFDGGLKYERAEKHACAYTHTYSPVEQ